MTSKQFSKWIKKQRKLKHLSIKDLQEKIKSEGIKRSYGWFSNLERVGNFGEGELEVFNTMAELFGYHLALVPIQEKLNEFEQKAIYEQYKEVEDEYYEKEAATNFETQKHINHVRDKMHKVLGLLLQRVQAHDASKLESPEMEYFAKYTELLAGLTYGSDEYKRVMAEMKPAIEHHYAKNSHHPEHYKNGINDMTLVDLIEMLCDWKAATLRHNDGNIRKSIEINAKRFDMSPQLVKIFENTINLLE